MSEGRMSITKLDELMTLVKSKNKKRLVVVYANDDHTIEAVNSAIEAGIVEVTLTGIRANIEKICSAHAIDVNKFEIIEQAEPMECGLLCCDLINQGKAHLIMKGSITTDDYMRCILNKERGLMEPGALLTHVTCLEMESLNKVLIVGDVAIIPYPTVDQKEKMLKFMINIAKKLGIQKPLAALIAPSEVPNKKILSSADCIELMERAQNGAFGDDIVDGPMAFDLAIDMEAVEIKKYKSPVGGKADVILFPNIDSGNVFYKTATKLLKSESAAIVVGAKVPAILTSRGDSTKSKLCSIALAAITTSA
jgi:phosphate butyryltransferase